MLFTDTIQNSRVKFCSKNFAMYEVHSISQNIQVRQPPVDYYTYPFKYNGEGVAHRSATIL
jgi:hypothetical protein